ncbi:MAG: DNA topoisomerase IB [Alphaproteobacteria bacterium]|nr:DNA topoisomerase IB [Alphaproteobacteria bacterium]MCW5741806.1 DNA topoisomerase IB [Alphaproteobacteria bacterium]
MKLAREKGLRIVRPTSLAVRRRRFGRGFRYVDASGAVIRDAVEIRRLKSLAVPPAYDNVRLSADPGAHLQAIGEDAAGRLQYRYHPLWNEVREALKARRLASLARSLPSIRRAVSRGLSSVDCDLGFASAAVVRLVTLTAMRAGGETYARERGTRGATTLLKSNLTLGRGLCTLRFKAKGGAIVSKDLRDRRFMAAVRRLVALPGRRLFQYRSEDGDVRPVRAADVNRFLREVAGRPVTLKDFRTLLASTTALKALAATVPADSASGRRAQIRAAVTTIAGELANTPTVCRTSYVHDAIVSAFEAGRLRRLAKRGQSTLEAAQALARVVARPAGDRDSPRGTGNPPRSGAVGSRG